MKLALASDDRILLELTAWDLQRYDLLPGKVDGSAETMRQKLGRVLSDLAKTTGKQYRLRRRVRVDYLPDRDGGCLLAVVGLDVGLDPAKRHCFTAQTENDLIDAARALCKTESGQVPVTLLKSARGYYLLTPSLDASNLRLLSEFLRELPLYDNAQEALKEQCVLLLDEKPLSTLCGGA